LIVYHGNSGHFEIKGYAERNMIRLLHLN